MFCYLKLWLVHVVAITFAFRELKAKLQPDLPRFAQSGPYSAKENHSLMKE